MASSQFASLNGVGSQHKISTKPFWEFNTLEINNWVRTLSPAVPNTGGMLFPKRLDPTTITPECNAQILVGNTLLQNLVRALSSASSYNGGGEPNPKRPKIENKGDMYQILDPSFAKSSGAASSELVTGAILSRMTLGGLVNGLAGVEGGVVDTLTCIPLDSSSHLTSGFVLGSVDEAAKKEETQKKLDELIATAKNIPLKEVIRMAKGLHRSVAAR